MGAAATEPIRAAHRLQRGAGTRLECVPMAEIVLRVRLVDGVHLDVTYEEPDAVDEDEVVEHAIATLANSSGVLRSRHGDRLIALYARGVAALEIAPRGAVL